MAGAPAGNRNGAKKNRLLTDALKRELTQNPAEVLAIARKLIEAAKAGEPWAQSLIHERVDGKVPQAIIGDDEEPPVRTTSRIELVALDGSGSGQAST
jgi:hypothetical protein